MKRIDWGQILTILEVVYVAAIIYILLTARHNGGSSGMRFWRTMMILAQRAAYHTGQAGLYAEKAYWHAVERARS